MGAGSRSWLFGLLSPLFFVLSLSGADARSGPRPMPEIGLSPCSGALAQAEKSHGIPDGLLAAVALAESGRWDADKAAIIAWPWTVTNGKNSQYLPSAEAAIAAVETLRRQGETNIDVGCMQVNLSYHPDAFASLAEAFDPAANVAYGARFLRDLHQESRSWSQAVRHYHSRTRTLSRPYLKRVFRLWNAVRRDAIERRRLALADLP